MSKITIHRALAQLKTTNERIESMFNSRISFVTTEVGKTGKTVKGLSVEDEKKTIISNWDKINGLINNYDKLRMAIIRSNSGVVDNIKTVNVCGKDYTVAELIYRQRAGEGWLYYTKLLISCMTSSLNKTLEVIQRKDEENQKRLDVLLASAAGGTDKKNTADTAAITTTFNENNSVTLVDPLNIKEKIEQYIKMCDDFAAEADSALAESNALTTIEVDLTD